MGVFTVVPKAGENSSSSSTQGLGSKKNSYMSWPEFQFDQDMHMYQNKWK